MANNPYTNSPYTSGSYFGQKPNTSFFGPTDLNTPPQQQQPPLSSVQQPNTSFSLPNVQQPQSGGGGISAVGNYLASPGGTAVTNLVGGALQSYQNQQNLEADRNLSAADKAAMLRQQQFNADRDDQRARATGVLNADPLGADQGYAQKQALMQAILPNLRNFRSAPGDAAVAGAMGAPRGGTMNALGPNGLDPEMVNRLFGPDATASAIAQRHQEINSLDPNAAQPNFQSMFGNTPGAQQAQQQVASWAQQLQQKTGAEKQAFEAQMNDYINRMVQAEGNDSSGFWHKFAKVAAIVGAAAATYFTAGAASPLLGAAIGAGAGAAGAWGNGASGMGILTGAALGGATSMIPGVGNAAGSAASTAAQTGVKAAAQGIAKNVVTNPAPLMSAILNR